MDALAADFLALDPSGKRRVHLILCRFALEKWETYTKSFPSLQYKDSVVGMDHIVDTRLPQDAFESSKTGLDGMAISERYREPVVALQDDDLELPENIEFSYYAIYNLFCKYVEKKTVDDWLIVNQALSSEQNSLRWTELLSDAMNKAKASQE
jgi:hypothetical protein